MDRNGGSSDKQYTRKMDSGELPASLSIAVLMAVTPPYESSVAPYEGDTLKT